MIQLCIICDREYDLNRDHFDCPHDKPALSIPSEKLIAAPVYMIPQLTLAEIEGIRIIEALEQHYDNRTHAAKACGISVRTLQRKLKSYGYVVTPIHPIRK